MGTRSQSFLFWCLLLLTTTCTTTTNVTPACPSECLCSSTEEGLHRAHCTSLSSLHKYSIKNKHHNINIINLHGAGVVKINNELDLFNEVVSLDLSDNKIDHLEKLLKNSKKLTHINLSQNHLKEFSATAISSSVSSLDLSNNRLTNVPSSLETLKNLEHLQLEKNPLDCSCNNLKILHHLHEHGVMFDNIKCFNKPHHKYQSWKEFNVAEICSTHDDIRNSINMEDMMMGDQPDDDAEVIAEDMSDRKSMPINDAHPLDTAKVFESSGATNDNDDEAFINVSDKPKEEKTTFEGSGDSDESTNNLGLLVEPTTEGVEGSGDAHDSAATEDYDYGSGDGITTTTEAYITGPLHPFLGLFGHITTTTEENMVISTEEIGIFRGGPVDWEATENEIIPTTEKMLEAIEEEISTKKLDPVFVQKFQEEASEQKPVKSSIGTYVCISILVLILIILIIIVLVKNHIRKRRDKHYIRQQKKDVEKADKEMVEMNKALLGKPANIAIEPAKKANGNYELVPTHDNTKKNGTLDSRKSADEEAIPKIVAPKETSENPNNNVPSYPNNRLSQSSDMLDSIPHMNGHNGGQHYPDSDLLGPPNSYVPVYDSDAGRVRIKMTETPKPKTPTLVTRSRSNAGDIIITPVSEPSSPVKNST